MVENARHIATQRWWRSLPDDVAVAEAQHRVDVFRTVKADARTRVAQEVGTKLTVAELADAERLRPVPRSPSGHAAR